MEVAVPEEPQKKIFRARKTMKMSDRQQLEALHSTLSNVASNSSSTPSSSSRPQTPLVNGTHMEDGQKVKEKEKDLQRQSPSLSDSRSPSPSVKKGSEKGKGEEKKGERKDEKKPEEADTDKMETSKSDRKGDPKKTPADQLFNGETAAMDTDGAPLDNGSAEEKEEKGIKSSSSSASGSPAAGLECDPEVKEGFLFLSEEDEGQGERDEVKEKSEEKMDLDAVKDEKKEAEGAQGCKAADSTGSGTPAAKKRSFSPEGGKDGRKDVDIKEERDGKRARVEGVELEAQLELKITANAGSRLKLEKVVQQLVEDRLRVLQLTVFDRNLKELKDRVEKIDSATKQQNALQHISTLQAKISRLSKKFGAANQATENSKKAQEAAAAKAAATTNTTTATQRIERTTLDPKQPNAPGSTSSTATPAQLKPLSTPTTPTSSALAAPAPILQILSTTTGSTPSSSTSSLTGQAQPGTLLLQTRPNTGVMNTNTATSGGQSMSIQPLLIQLPLAMANGQAGTLAGGVGLIPVSSLATVNNLNKAKTTTATTTIILQKSAGNVVSSSSPSSSSTAPQMSSGRSMYQGGSGAVSSPSAAVSVTTARTPTQCAAVVGVATASSSPATTGPAATGSAAAATCPPSASAMASKTDNQASNSTPAKSPSQSARPKSSFIDLTEDDDDVQVTGVQKATASSITTTTQRLSGPPPLVSSTSVAGRSAVQHRPSVDLPSKSRPGSSSSTPLPPLPLAPTPPARLPPEAAHTSPPQQPQLKLARVQSQNGIVLSWCVAETDRNCAAVDSYHLYAYHQDHQGAAASGAASSQSLWKKIGEVKALPLPMACTLTQFVSGSTYYFAVRAKDVYGRFGPFCEPQCTDVINPPSSGSS
ncbi:activating transcription factor 7-interacting protein 1 isoform X1 [Colossoma macropomum]|uniref:activating transcription factor 7-interacting protein 1 isoform X1 n=1 Tax=Colossoma macropomum TaxID=42526 RepID=UPI001864AFBA|nr:activating transcription factor 7-interacting protein 1 isoform X1 [Colossoma macropomum]XP_036419377.1 activating transcription factor 7-interacting protein 1 isoform X1 [Colossoma macropomum]XP_036419378.1 activating transcription factor 7-interacting protein 1 isoform X1 [Colossoma macropomum]XP_036419379.1 activating transcription factor 7-interacting protein 1 isoform X1 [Colossoma macropomum]XP_036419380.1 activating transcription factor 7-interacting protein 1 isoform X1 [Colossoma ma